MKILIGCDVDPVLPPVLRAPTGGNIWEPLDRIPDLIGTMGDTLPPITWLIRADESVRFAAGDYASGYSSQAKLWSGLRGRGHELGWHMHLLSFDRKLGAFQFDGRPSWLGQAHAALSAHYDIRATRTGWDYGSSFLFRELATLGVEVDFSALPGHRGWRRLGPRTAHVDWLRCLNLPYRPSAQDYQQPGPDSLALVEVPIAQFRNAALGQVKRLAWRLSHGCCSFRGLGQETRLLTDAWDALPMTDRGVWAFFFHPQDLTAEGIRNAIRNIERLRAEPEAEFVTAATLRRWYDSKVGA